MGHKILFLDDRIERIDLFLQVFPEAVIALSANHFYNMACLCLWDCVFLDHDLNHFPHQLDQENNNGMHVVEWIIQNKLQATRIGVHSTNPEAVSKMLAALLRAGYCVQSCPFEGSNNSWIALVSRKEIR